MAYGVGSPASASADDVCEPVELEQVCTQVLDSSRYNRSAPLLIPGQPDGAGCPGWFPPVPASVASIVLLAIPFFINVAATRSLRAARKDPVLHTRLNVNLVAVFGLAEGRTFKDVDRLQMFMHVCEIVGETLVLMLSSFTAAGACSTTGGCLFFVVNAGTSSVTLLAILVALWQLWVKTNGPGTPRHNRRSARVGLART